MKKILQFTAPVIAIFLVLAMTLPVSASWDTDIGGGTAVTITDEEQMDVDAFLGVHAYYSSTSSKFTASELVARFYSLAYNLSISTSGAPTITTDGYEFKIPYTPKNGDVVYGSGGHWAIVKTYNKSKGTITIFEQGNASGGKVYKDRTLKFPSDSYTVYTPREKSGHSQPKLIDVSTGKTVSFSRSQVYSDTNTSTSAAKTTTSRGQTTNQSDTQITTEAPPTGEFTTFVGEDEPLTTADSTFTTVSMPEGYEEFFTTTGPNGDAPYDPEAGSTQNWTYDDSYAGVIETTNVSETVPESKSVNPTLIFGLAMIGGIVCITAAGIFAGVLIKKRAEEEDDF